MYERQGAFLIAIRKQNGNTVLAGHDKRALALLAGSAMATTMLWCHNAMALSNPNESSLATLQSNINAQKLQLQREELELEQQAIKLDNDEVLLNQQLQNLHGRGTGNAAATPQPAEAAASASSQSQPPQSQAPQTQVRQASNGQTASIQGPTPSEKQTRAVLQTDTSLSGNGGVLTPRGHIILDPSLEYDYYSSNQLAVNGFTIIPGITFGNIYIARIQQNVATLALTTRWGVTDRLELNVKIPVVAEYGITTTQAVGPDAVALTPSANNVNIGDIQFGASYQFNRDDTGWPIFIGNLVYKTATGVSPYSVPIWTVSDPNGQYLEGIQRKLPTGTGFNALEPSVTILYPTDPGVLFANIQYIYNFGSKVDLPNPAGGPSIRTSLKAGNALAATFGFGFALNEHTSMTLSYEQQHVFGASQDGQAIKGSAYDFGEFNFGVSYQINRRTSVNLGVSMGVGPNAPVAKILLDVPINVNLL